MGRKTLVFHSALTPTLLTDTLSRTIDQESWTLFSFSGFRGNRPLLGKIGEGTFRLRKRRDYRNDFAPLFYAHFVPEPGGTRIEGYFDSPRFARYFMRFWLAGVVTIGLPICLMSLRDLVTGSHDISGDAWAGILVPCGLVLFGMLLPRFGRLLSRDEERYISQYIQETLAARLEEPGIE
jgi:hypothetical protein